MDKYLKYLEKTYPYVEFDLTISDFSESKLMKTFVFVSSVGLLRHLPVSVTSSCFPTARLKFYRMFLNRPKIKHIPVFWDRVYISKISKV